MVLLILAGSEWRIRAIRIPLVLVVSIPLIPLVSLVLTAAVLRMEAIRIPLILIPILVIPVVSVPLLLFRRVSLVLSRVILLFPFIRLSVPYRRGLRFRALSLVIWGNWGWRRNGGVIGVAGVLRWFSDSFGLTGFGCFGRGGDRVVHCDCATACFRGLSYL